MSLQPPSVFTNVEDCSGNKHYLCCGCPMISAIKVVANLLMLFCKISWHFHQQSWDTGFKNGTQKTLNSSSVPKWRGFEWLCTGVNYPIFSEIIQMMDIIIVTDSMANIVCKSITPQDHHLKLWSKDLES